METKNKDGGSSVALMLSRECECEEDPGVDFENLERLFVGFEGDPRLIFEIEKALKGMYLENSLPTAFLRNVRFPVALMEYVASMDLSGVKWEGGENEECRVLLSCVLTLAIVVSDKNECYSGYASEIEGFYERLLLLATKGNKEIVCRSLGVMACLLVSESVFCKLRELGVYDHVIPGFVPGDEEVVLAASNIVGKSYKWMDKREDGSLELFLRLVQLFLGTRLVGACNSVLYGLSRMIRKSERSSTVIEAAYESGLLRSLMGYFEDAQMIPAVLMLFDCVVNEENCEIGMKLLAEGLLAALYAGLRVCDADVSHMVVSFISKCTSRDPDFLRSAIVNGVIRQLYEVFQNSNFEAKDKAARTVADWFCVQHDQEIVQGMIADGGFEIISDFLPCAPPKTALLIIHALNHLLTNTEDAYAQIVEHCQEAIECIAYETPTPTDEATKDLVAAAQALSIDLDERQPEHP